MPEGNLIAEAQNTIGVAGEASLASRDICLNLLVEQVIFASDRTGDDWVRHKICLSYMLDLPPAEMERVMQDRYAGRVAFITGAGKGLGRAYAHYLAARGATIIVNNRKRADAPSSADQVVAELTALGYRAIADEYAVEDEAGAAAMIAAAKHHFGRLDIMILNAATQNVRAPLHEQSSADIRATMEVNLLGAIWPLRAALPVMRAQDYGRIVLTSSAVGLYGLGALAPYAATKAAMIGLARAVAEENKDRNIKINLISPYAKTAMAPGIDARYADLLSVEKIAPVVGYLCAESCAQSGAILIAAAGRMRLVQLAEGPLAQVTEDIHTLPPQFETLQAPHIPGFANDSLFELAPEVAKDRVTRQAGR